MATAAILVEAARMDDHFDPVERRAIRRLLGVRFGLDEPAVTQLLAAAESAASRSSDLFRFTQTLVEAFDPAGRIELIEMLWEVAYADGVLEPEEDMLIRRIAGLVHVEDQDRGAARQRVLARLAR
jgi:uncharacterized tellurite resistance protein B-like protein